MRLIDADELRAYWEECKSMFKEGDPKRKQFDDAIWDLDHSETADVVERKKGKWIRSRMPVTGAIEHRCSECDTPYYMAFCFQMNYCPNCGAEMETYDEP